MFSAIKKIHEFYVMCGADNQFKNSPTANVTEEIKKLRIRLIQEEFDELKKAMSEDDLIEVADALGDLVYVILGTVLAYGLQYKFVDIFNEIHRSNMTKAGPNGKAEMREDGKIIKPGTFENPKIKEILDSNICATKFMPKIVCLCGSTRFIEAFQEANLRETLAGNIVLSVGCNTKSDKDLMAAGVLSSDIKEDLDELHKRKIDLADEVIILNVGGYIGSSTRSEIDYANTKGKKVSYLEYWENR